MGNLWAWIRSDVETHSSFTLVGTGQLACDIYSTSRWYAGNEITMRSFVPEVVTPKGLEKKKRLSFQRHVILDA